MPSLKNQKDLKNLTEKFKVMKGMILTEYHGLSVEEISDLRLKLRLLGCEYIVVKNTLSELALKGIGIESKSNFFGPTAIIIETEDIVSPAKVVVDFAKSHTKLKIKAGFFEGKFVDVSVIEQLSSLPSKEALVAKLLGSMNSPVTSFLNVLIANIRAVVTVLDKIAKKQVA